MIVPKVEIKKILYTTDLSENALEAFAYAVSLANLYNASIVILHVLADMPDAAITYIGEDKWQEIKDRHLEDARGVLIGKAQHHSAMHEALTKFCDDALAECVETPFVTDEIVIKSGDPAEHIVEQAEKKNCDLIVMGSRGHGALLGAMVGSTTQRVIRRTQKPVMLVRFKQ